MDTSIPFELHITVADIVLPQLERFSEICSEMGGKPLLIVLSRGDYCTQPMFNAVIHENDLSRAVETAKLHATILTSNGFDVSRLKIEVPAFCYGTVNDTNQLQNVDYFEWHGKVDFERTKLLLEICEANTAHLSKNALKDSDNKRFITLRELEKKTTFESRLANLVNDLERNNYKIYKQQAEYCVYDTNVLLDKNWLA